MGDPLRLLVLQAEQADHPTSAEAPERRLGVEVHRVAPLRVRIIDQALAELLGDGPEAPDRRWQWLALTSRHAVRSLSAALARRGGDMVALPRVACLEGATAEAVRLDLGHEPSLSISGGGAALAEALILAGSAPATVLFPRAAEGREELPTLLRAAGWSVQALTCYETVADSVAVDAAAEAICRGRYAAVAFGSPRGAEALLEGLRRAGDGAARALARLRVGAIGSTTARTLIDRGIRVDVVPEAPSFDVLVDALVASLANAGELG